MSIFGNFFISANGGTAVTVTGSFMNAVNSPDVWQPAADLLEVENGFVVQMDLPGVEADSLELTLEGECLIVRGVRRGYCSECRKRYLQMEVNRGVFGKIVPLPASVSEANCTAALKDGVLEVFLPRGKPSYYAVMAIQVIKED